MTDKPQEDNILLTVSITVKGTDFEEMLHTAKLEGAARLHKFFDQVYIIGHSQPLPADRTRFRAHLDEPSEIESWAITATIGIKKEDATDGESPTEH